jgi:alkylation response protein AidB-like acyl-CoA dehydrogenase
MRPVDFDLSPDQSALAGGARDLLDGHSGPAQVRAHLDSGEPYSTAMWRAMAEQGWFAVAVPEEHGGLGLGWVEVAVLLAEVGRHTTPVPFLPTVLALAALSRDGSHPDLVDRLASGDALGAVAWAKAPGVVTVVGDGDAPVLSGRLGPVDGASVADVLVVVAPEGVFLVDLAAVGRPQRQPAMDLTRALAWVDLDATPAVRLGDTADAAHLSALGAVGSAAELLGGSERALEMATEYAKDRVQFGAPIGSFQAVKHRCADMLVDVEGMRSATWYGAWAVASGDPAWASAAATAKIWSADASKRVMASALQVHGGIGFTWEHDLHLFIKRAQFSQLDYGDAAHHRAALGAILRDQVLAGAAVI